MTGFGAAHGAVGRAGVSVEVRTVNHRFFNPSVRLPPAYSQWEAEVRETLRQHITRGHVTAVVRIDRSAEDGVIAVDETRFAAYAQHLTVLKARYGVGGEVDVATVLRMPHVVAAPTVDAEEGGNSAGHAAGGTPTELVAVVDAAARALTSMREAEGARLASYLEERVQLVEEALGRIAVRSPARLTRQRDRLREAVRQLAPDVKIDEGRLAQEIAILADKLDVSEELDRFRAHVAAFRDALEGRTGGDLPVGKRLGFLVQEMLREANTTGAKAADAAILHDVVAIKEELERIREQVDNLE
jgi:uncharacterized protein (TIGR00255 family)